MGRKRQSTPHTRPMESVLNEILAALRKQAEPANGDQHARFTGSMEYAVGAILKLDRRPDGRYSGVSTYLAPLYWLKAVVPISKAISGMAASQSAPSQAVYLVHMTRKITRDDVLRYRIHNAEHQRELRERKLRQERAAGDTPDTTTGGEVTTRHYHTQPLEHEHGHQAGSHIHAPLDQDVEIGPEGLDSRVIWHTMESDSHRDVQSHAHGSKTGPHEHRNYQIVWLTTRRSSTRTKPDPNHPAVPDVPAAVHYDIRDDVAGFRQVVVASPETDGRYRGLLDIISDLEADKSRMIAKDEQQRERIGWLEGEVRRLAEEVLRARDASVSEADAKLAQYGKKS